MGLAERVKEKRQEMKLTQTELAELTGVSQQGINRLESGFISKPRFLYELSKALQCDIEWLISGKQSG